MSELLIFLFLAFSYNAMKHKCIWEDFYYRTYFSSHMKKAATQDQVFYISQINVCTSM